MYCILL